MHFSECVAMMLWMQAAKRTTFPPNISVLLSLRNEMGLLRGKECLVLTSFHIFSLSPQRFTCIVRVLFILVSQIDHQNSIRRYSIISHKHSNKHRASTKMGCIRSIYRTLFRFITEKQTIHKYIPYRHYRIRICILYSCIEGSCLSSYDC